MTEVETLASFAVNSRYEDLTDEAVRALKVRILDALGCALGAMGAPPVRDLRGYLEDVGGAPAVTLIGGGRTSPDRAALYNGALVRYLDYNDSYLAKGETCHPSDNLAPVLAAVELADGGGRDLLTALAVAYQVQCRLSDEAPVRARGFDHTTQGSYAVAAGVSRALDLDTDRAANAIAIAGTAFNALRVTRTGRLSNWKGLAYPNTAFCATHAVLLARRGITGPSEVFEGNKGFKDAIAGDFSIDWMGEDLERVTRTIVKKFNAEVHSQSTLEGVLALKEEHGFEASGVEAVELEVFDVAYNIIGGGEEGSKREVRTKEEADHSLLYMVAAALLDGWVGPRQYRPERIVADDVQALLRRVRVSPADDLSRRFPAEMPVRITIRLRDGRSFSREQPDYEGFVTRPMSWEGAMDKFSRLAEPAVGSALAGDIAEAVEGLEERRAAELTGLLGRAGKERPS